MLQRNGFKGGMNKDADSSVMPPDFYLDAHNLTLTGDGKFFALENIKGTTELGVLDISFFGEVMAVYENRYTIGTDTNVRCLTIFTAESGGNFQIWCYRLDTNAIKKLFAQSFDADFEAANPEIDAVVYPEGGLDIIYFTDNYNELRKLRCEIPTGAADNFLKESDLSLQRRGTMATALYTVQSSGGSLTAGSYQFVFRLFNEDTRSYSRWTVPSWPVNVSSSGEGYYDFNTSKKIDITFRLLDSEIPFWTHFQVGVIENISAQVQTVGALQQVTALSGGTVNVAGYTDYAFSYKSNERISDLALSDVVVDLAAIETAKTIQVKNNRLFVGNIKYSNLDYDRTPTVTGDTIVQTTANATDDNNTTAYRGYFRDELYRFYIVYWDDYYNLSRPKALDMTSVTNNISAGPDYRFRRSISKLDGSNNYNNMGLSLTVDNHPSWARGFAIFRAKRKKNKIFQSPFIPAIEVAGIDAIGNYPNTADEIDALSPPVATISADFPDATPMNPLGTLLPKDLMKSISQHIIKHRNDNLTYTGGQREVQGGEVCYQTDEHYTGPARKFGFIFEPRYQYGVDTPYTPKASDKLYVADVAFTKLNHSLLNSNTFDSPKNEGLQAHGTFFANQSADYWRDNVTPSPVWPLGTSRTLGIDDYAPIDNVGEGTSLGGSDVCKHSNLSTSGTDLWSTPTNNRMGLIQYEGMVDVSYYSNSFKAGKIAAGFKKTALGSPNASNTATNDPVFNMGGFSPNSSHVNAVAIVDIESGLGDDRYGDLDTIHDVVFTGAQYLFKDSELSTVASTGVLPITLSVWGGDCYVSRHVFKIANNSPAITNVEKWNGTSTSLLDQGKRWRRVFRNKYGATISMPTFYKGVSTVLSVVIESEINGEVLAKSVYPDNYLNIPTLLSTSLGSTNVPFTYLYNRGYSTESDQKALVPQLDTEQIVTDYRARVLYSDQKVYNSDIQGFDVFRVSNFTDLDESSYSLTKLTLDGDNLVAIQEQGIAVIPVDASLLSTTDGATISVRSGTTDLPVYISRLYGSQHLKSVVKSGDAVFFVDNRNQRVFRLGGGQLDIISDKGMVKQFNADLASTVAQIRGMWDNNRAHYWVFNENFCYLWDDRLKVWVSSHDVSPDDGVYTSEGLLTISHFDDRLAVHKMYDGEYNSFYTQTVTPKVSFVVNAEYENNKVFDTIIAYSNGKMDSLDVVTSKENGAFGGESLGTAFAYNRREGYYTVPTLRDIHGARMRGTYAEVTIYWPTDNEKITLSQVVTAYRNSPRLPQ